jgi:hypothetical protein
MGRKWKRKLLNKKIKCNLVITNNCHDKCEKKQDPPPFTLSILIKTVISPICQRMQAALSRIRSGEYGYCVLCGEEIAEGRPVTKSTSHKAPNPCTWSLAGMPGFSVAWRIFSGEPR